jgi:hypothetical protein
MLFDYQPCGGVVGNSTYMHFDSELLDLMSVWTKGRLARAAQRLSCRYS